MKYIAPIEPLFRGFRKRLMSFYGNAGTIEKKSSSAHDVVTALDKEVEVFFKERLSKLYPDAGFFGEEFGGKETKKYWLMDPIDGTGLFVRGIPMCTSMLALIENGRPVFSAIYDFVQNDLYVAGEGEGAWKNGKRISVSGRDVASSYCALEIDPDHPKMAEVFRKMRNAGMIPLEIVNCGFAFAMVASGKLDARIGIAPFGKDWDYAPGALLVGEAGGVVKNFHSQSYDFHDHEFYAANPTVAEWLEEHIVPILDLT